MRAPWRSGQAAPPGDDGVSWEMQQSGELHWLRNIVNVVRDDNGQPARIRGFIVDISEGKSL